MILKNIIHTIQIHIYQNVSHKSNKGQGQLKKDCSISEKLTKNVSSVNVASAVSIALCHDS